MFEITLRFQTALDRRKTQVVVIPVSENVGIADMRKLLEFEQWVNSLPGCDVRLHANLEERRGTDAEKAARDGK